MAENQKVGRTWDGAGNRDALALTVSDEKFDLLEGDAPLFRAPRVVSFARHEAGREWAEPRPPSSTRSRRCRRPARS
jgi:hypothetical protein